MDDIAEIFSIQRLDMLPLVPGAFSALTDSSRRRPTMPAPFALSPVKSGEYLKQDSGKRFFEEKQPEFVNQINGVIRDMGRRAPAFHAAKEI